MVRHSDGRTASLLESAGPGTSRPVDSRIQRPVDSRVRRPNVASPVDVYEADDALVVRVRLVQGPLELRVPQGALKARHHHPRHHIEGFNADATPC